MTTGPREGDLVRAVEDSREATVVEGVLRLRLVPSLDYMLSARFPMPDRPLAQPGEDA